MMPEPSMLAAARDAALRNGIEPALVCAVIEQESAWNPNAMRYEGAFRARYVAPLGLQPTEEIARSISWGLMQVMGQVAREHGFSGKFLSALCDPGAGVAIGCEVLASKIWAAGGPKATVAAAVSVVSAACISACHTASLGCVTIGLPASEKCTAIPTLADDVCRRALALWNGGANPDYPAQVLARVDAYR